MSTAQLVTQGLPLFAPPSSGQNMQVRHETLRLTKFSVLIKKVKTNKNLSLVLSLEFQKNIFEKYSNSIVKGRHSSSVSFGEDNI